MGEPIYWRYFRVHGEPPRYSDLDLFTMVIHHGGRFHSERGCNRFYQGGEVVYVDGVDPDKVSVTGINYWAHDLGYQRGPIGYWFMLPGSVPGTGYLPIVTDKDCQDMCRFVPKSSKRLEMYIVCLAERKSFTTEELGVYQENLDHEDFFGHFIEDIEDGQIEIEDDSDEEDMGSEDHELADEDNEVVDLDHDVPIEVHEVGKTTDVGPQAGGAEQGAQATSTVTEQPNRNGITSTGQKGKAKAADKEKQKAVGNGKKKPVCKGKQKVRVEEDVPAPKKRKGRPRRYATRFGGESSNVGNSGVEGEPDSNSTTDSDDPNFEGIIDSDWEDLDSDAEDVQFQQNVDGDPGRVHEFDEMGYDGLISDEEGYDSDRAPSLHDSSDEEVEDTGPFPVKCRKRYSDWREFNKKYDMKNPSFELGMAFANSKEFKQAMRKHSVLTKRELRFTTNTRHKVRAVCRTSDGCPFVVYASTTDTDNPTIFIRTLRTEHTCCSLGERVYHMNAPFLAEEYMDFFMNDPNWTREGIQNAVNKDFGMNLGYQMCYRAKQKATKLAQGSFEDQYNLLESYAHELKKRNPGTSVWIQTELDGEVTRFKRIYICIEALKVGWREGCRPIIGLDGCHLKSVHKGQLLTAVGIDGNNGIYPIAWAVVEAETRESWTWFLEFLKVDLSIHHSSHFSFMSDKQKGLEQAIKELFPDSQHRHCVRHLHNNFRSDGHGGLELKQKLWAVARAYSMRDYATNMEELKKSSLGAWQWCLDRPAIHWSRSHFHEKFKCDVLLNNHSESFNKSILPARKKAILGLLEDIRTATMVRLATRRHSGPNWRCKVGPRVENQLKKNASCASDYRPLQSSEWRYELQGRGVGCKSGVVAQHSIALDLRTCTCKRWDISGLPCGHAIAAIYSKGLSPDAFVDECFTKEKYMKAYEPIMHPITGVKEWEIINRPIAPPLYRRQPGRPKITRTKEPGEVAPPSGLSNLPKVYYSQVKCGICKKKGHNKRTCKQSNQAQPPPAEVQADNVEPEAVPAENVQEDVPAPDPAPADVPNVVSQQFSDVFHPTQSSQAPATSGFKQRTFKSLAQRKPKPPKQPQAP